MTASEAPTRALSAALTVPPPRDKDLLDAARAVVWFDWSDNDKDAVDAIHALRVTVEECDAAQQPPAPLTVPREPTTAMIYAGKTRASDENDCWKDAERYRWLRAWPDASRPYMVGNLPWVVRIELQGGVPTMTAIYETNLDIAIDAALAGAKTGEGNG